MTFVASLPSCACNAVCLPSFLLLPFATPSSFPPFPSSNACVLVRVFADLSSDVVLLALALLSQTRS